MSILLTIGILVLIFVSVIMGLLVLMQRSKDGGAGAAMGGGVAEATFGAETNTVLSTATIRASIIFFVLAFLLYLGYVYDFHIHNRADVDGLPSLAPSAPATTAPASTAPIPDATVPAGTVPTPTVPTPVVPTPSPVQ